MIDAVWGPVILNLVVISNRHEAKMGEKKRAVGNTAGH